MASISELQKEARKFIDDRDWRKFQTAKELAANISVEANELLELFLWKNEKDIDRDILGGNDKELLRKIKNETADVF
jgi:hypothetical protein